MIPKIIHYCWFGRNHLPESAQKCINSWKKYLPDYEIKEWNEDNFDVNSIPYTKQAYEARKYAFVSDYARFWILYNHGGLYFDTDVELIKPLDDILLKGSFMGCEKMTKLQVEFSQCFCPNPGLGMGCEAGNNLLKELLLKYENMLFIGKSGIMNQKTIVAYTKEALVKRGLGMHKGIQFVGGFYIYPDDFFCPLGLDGKLVVTHNTRSIHHYMASWSDSNQWDNKKDKIKNYIIERVLPKTFVIAVLRYKEEKRKKLFNEMFLIKNDNT